MTGKDRPGIQTYRRSALFVMLKALYEIAGRENVEKVCVDFSIGDGLFVEAKGNFPLNEETVGKIKEKMREYVEAKIPIMKRSVNTDEAVELFHRHGMYDKERLFRYRGRPGSISTAWAGLRIIFMGIWSRIPAISGILTWFPISTGLY